MVVSDSPPPPAPVVVGGPNLDALFSVVASNPAVEEVCCCDSGSALFLLRFKPRPGLFPITGTAFFTGFSASEGFLVVLPH